MSSAIFRLCEWLEATPLGVMVRESLWVFPILVAIHIMGLIFSAGIVVWLDLRLLGVSMPGVPVSTVYYFFAKMGALLLAALNAFIYHAHIERRIALWDRSPGPPLAARLAGIISILLWTTVIMAGRMMAYTLYSR